MQKLTLLRTFSDFVLLGSASEQVTWLVWGFWTSSCRLDDSHGCLVPKKNDLDFARLSFRDAFFATTSSSKLAKSAWSIMIANFCSEVNTGEREKSCTRGCEPSLCAFGEKIALLREQLQTNVTIRGILLRFHAICSRK